MMESIVTQQTYADVAAHFNSMAPKYDFGSGKVKWLGPSLVAENVKKYFGNASKNLKVLDLGAGTGLLAEELKKDSINVHITGVDIAAQMLTEAIRKKRIDIAKALSITSSDWVEEDAFDAVTIAGVYDFINHEDTESLAERIAKSLKPWGIVSGTYEPVGTAYGYKTIQHSPEVLRDQFQKYGIEIFEEREIGQMYKSITDKSQYVGNRVFIGQKNFTAS